MEPVVRVEPVVVGRHVCPGEGYVDRHRRILEEDMGQVPARRLGRAVGTFEYAIAARR